MTKILLAEIAPALGDIAANLERLEELVLRGGSELSVFPELYLSGYAVGDRVHQLALRPDGPEMRRLAEIARTSGSGIVVGAPVRSRERPGETQNAALWFGSDGSSEIQPKRFLPTFGPFEEGHHFTATNVSRPAASGAISLGMQICYDLFFPEVSRDLSMQGAQLLVAISAAPVTSRRLFDRVLPARAIENAVPIVYVNRVGAEDGLVFGGGSTALDPRGETLPLQPLEGLTRSPEERIGTADLDLTAADRWRPFRPVLRDLGQRSPQSEGIG